MDLPSVDFVISSGDSSRLETWRQVWCCEMFPHSSCYPPHSRGRELRKLVLRGRRPKVFHFVYHKTSHARNQRKMGGMELCSCFSSVLLSSCGLWSRIQAGIWPVRYWFSHFNVTWWRIEEHCSRRRVSLWDIRSSVSCVQLHSTGWNRSPAIVVYLDGNLLFAFYAIHRSYISQVGSCLLLF